MGLFDDLFDDYEEENNITEFVLLDETVVLKKQSSDLGAVIEVRPTDKRFANDMYIKISKNKDGWNAANPKEKVRISITSPSYVYHDGDPGNMSLNAKERKTFINDLNKEYKDSGHTVWEEILLQIYNETKDKSVLDLLMPDYTKLK